MSNECSSRSLAKRSSLTRPTLRRPSSVTNRSAALSIALSTSVPVTSPSGPTHSLRIRSHPSTPQPTSRARAPRPSPISSSSPRPLGSQTRDCSCRRSSSEACPARRYPCVFVVGIASPYSTTAVEYWRAPRRCLRLFWPGSRMAYRGHAATDICGTTAGSSGSPSPPPRPGEEHPELGVGVLAPHPPCCYLDDWNGGAQPRPRTSAQLKRGVLFARGRTRVVGRRRTRGQRRPRARGVGRGARDLRAGARGARDGRRTGGIELGCVVGRGRGHLPGGARARLPPEPPGGRPPARGHARALGRRRLPHPPRRARDRERLVPARGPHPG